MLNFKPLTLNDISIVKPFLRYSETRLCDSSTGGIFIWRDFFQIEYDIKNDTLYLKINLKDKTAFTVPIGVNFKESSRESLDEVIQYCLSSKIPKFFCAVSENDFHFFKNHYQIKSYGSKREWYDYLYNSSDIVNLTGRKYNGQRNHINKFKRLYPSYKFEMINSSHIDKIKQFLFKFYNEDESLKNKDYSDKSTNIAEREKVFEIFNDYRNYEIYGLNGGIISINDNIIALALGEIINDTLYVNIEKADKSYEGIYPVIVNEFAKYYVSDKILYINREDDMGNEGLRKSKMSYHPIQLLTKYTVELE